MSEVKTNLEYHVIEEECTLDSTFECITKNLRMHLNDFANSRGSQLLNLKEDTFGKKPGGTCSIHIKDQAVFFII